MPSPNSFSNSRGERETESALGANWRFLRCSIKSGNSPTPWSGRGGGFFFPISPFLRGTSIWASVFNRDGVFALRGVPGDVGGRASGAELIEWAPRLCVCGLGLDGPASGECVLVNVIVTENGSPAKYDDCEGVTTTRIGESLLVLAAVKPGIEREKYGERCKVVALRSQMQACRGDVDSGSVSHRRGSDVEYSSGSPCPPSLYLCKVSTAFETPTTMKLYH